VLSNHGDKATALISASRRAAIQGPGHDCTDDTRIPHTHFDLSPGPYPQGSYGSCVSYFGKEISATVGDAFVTGRSTGNSRIASQMPVKSWRHGFPRYGC